MSKAAVSSRVFAVYLFIVGAGLVLAPNLLLSLFRIPPASDVWIHVVGLLAFMIGVYAWVAGRHEDRSFLAASVYTRFVVFIAFVAFALMEWASPMVALFGVVDLAGGLWTHAALKADARGAG